MKIKYTIQFDLPDNQEPRPFIDESRDMLRFPKGFRNLECFVERVDDQLKSLIMEAIERHKKEGWFPK